MQSIRGLVERRQAFCQQWSRAPSAQPDSSGLGRPSCAEGSGSGYFASRKETTEASPEPTATIPENKKQEARVSLAHHPRFLILDFMYGQEITMEAVLAPFWTACRLTSQGKKLPLFIGNLPFDATEEDLRTLLTTNDCLARVAGTQKVAKRKIKKCERSLPI